jgi:predicted nucleic acid-binding Zn ribbon protein
MEHIVKEMSIPDLWLEILGEPANRYSKVLRYQNRQLIVQVESSVWRTELRLRENDLLKRLNERLGTTLVDEIVFRA